MYCSIHGYGHNDCLLHSSELVKERKENICEKTRLSQSALAI